jgi:hypothetical protein
MNAESRFEGWFIVELMGRKKTAGWLCEQAIAGAGFIRIDVPASDDEPMADQIGDLDRLAIGDHDRAVGSADSRLPDTDEDPARIAQRPLGLPVRIFRSNLGHHGWLETRVETIPRTEVTRISQWRNIPPGRGVLPRLRRSRRLRSRLREIHRAHSEFRRGSSSRAPQSLGPHLPYTDNRPRRKSIGRSSASRSPSPIEAESIEGHDAMTDGPLDRDPDWRDECHCPAGIGDCDGCNALASCLADDPDHGPDRCRHCGKELEDFSDLGCELCDARHPGFGIIP